MAADCLVVTSQVRDTTRVFVLRAAFLGFMFLFLFSLVRHRDRLHCSGVTCCCWWLLGVSKAPTAAFRESARLYESDQGWARHIRRVRWVHVSTGWQGQWCAE